MSGLALKALSFRFAASGSFAPAVSSEYVAFVPGPQQEAVVVDSAVVDSTDEADAEVASYYRDTPPTLQPAPFCYNSPSPCATSPADVVHSRTAIQHLRPTSRPSVMSVHLRAGGGPSRASS